jgi:plasmid stability protein
MKTLQEIIDGALTKSDSDQTTLEIRNEPDRVTKELKMNATLKASGKQIELYTDDTLTLAFPACEEMGSECELAESSPALLRHALTEESLRDIAENSTDSSERSKAEKALECTPTDWEKENHCNQTQRAFAVYTDPSF